MRSFKGRVILLTAGVALVAVVLTTWAIAATTQDSVVDRLDQRAATEFEITERLTLLALEINDWRSASDFVEDLANEYDVRIALTDIDGRLLVDTSPGNGLPPLVSIIDPLGPFASFGEGISEEELAFATTECLEAKGIQWDFADGGLLFFDDEIDPGELDLCVGQALEDFGLIRAEGVAEPAQLFVDFIVEPQVPWAQLILVAAVVAAVAAGAAAATSGVVAGPIRRLTDATRDIRSGDLGARVDASAPEEVRQLAESFNEMAAALQREDSRRKQLTSDIAHELRSPVTNIIGHLDAVSDGVIAASPEHLAVVSSEAGRLHRLIEDLGQLAQVEEGQLVLDRHELDVGALVRRIVDAHRPAAQERSITLECYCPAALATVDGPRVEQIVGNLLTNAHAAVEEGGTVSVTVGADAANVTVTVADDGPGIPAELLLVIFDRFRRGDEARSPAVGSRGLGLAIARALARAHGGDLVARNRTEGGAEFTLALPR